MREVVVLHGADAVLTALSCLAAGTPPDALQDFGCSVTNACRC